MSGPYWVNELNNELKQMYPSEDSIRKWKRRYIYRLPAYVTDLKRRAFQPRTVSIGPYHYGGLNLKVMEQHKHQALFYFLERSKKPLQSFVDALMPFVQDLKDAYDELDLKWQDDTDAFLKLMILDGCFILETLLVTTSTSVWSSQVDSPRDRHAREDPMFSDHGRLYLVSYLKRDMLMLENQIPILVLQILFHVAFPPVNSTDEESLKESHVVIEIDRENLEKQNQEKVARLILSFLSQPYVSNIEPFLKCLHMLDMYRTSLILENPRRKKKISCFPGASFHWGKHSQDIIGSVAELEETGIRFKRSKSRNLTDISFHNGILELPRIVVDDALESIYLNMIAYERLHVGAGTEVTSYIFFMDTLIKIPTDVIILESRGIIQNTLGSDAAAILFNSLSTGIIPDPNSHLDMVRKQISEYCQYGRVYWKPYFMHLFYDFFNRRERDALSFLITMYLFCFTIIQTIVTILSYASSSTHK